MRHRSGTFLHVKSTSLTVWRCPMWALSCGRRMLVIRLFIYQLWNLVCATLRKIKACAVALTTEIRTRPKLWHMRKSLAPVAMLVSVNTATRVFDTWRETRVINKIPDEFSTSFKKCRPITKSFSQSILCISFLHLTVFAPMFCSVKTCNFIVENQFNRSLLVRQCAHV